MLLQERSGTTMSTRIPHSPVRAVCGLFAIGAVTAITIACTVSHREDRQATMQRNQMSTHAVRIDWKFGAPPDRIWAAWTDPHMVRRWFGSDPNGTVLETYLDVRVGGRFEVTFANEDGKRYTATGVYRVVEHGRGLQFSWHWRDEPGVETAVSVALLPDGTGTRMQFEHAGLVHRSTHNYESGWRSTFEKMERAVASGTRQQDVLSGSPVDVL